MARPARLHLPMSPIWHPTGLGRPAAPDGRRAPMQAAFRGCTSGDAMSAAQDRMGLDAQEGAQEAAAVERASLSGAMMASWTHSKMPARVSHRDAPRHRFNAQCQILIGPLWRCQLISSPKTGHCTRTGKAAGTCTCPDALPVLRRQPFCGGDCRHPERCPACRRSTGGPRLAAVP